MKRYEPRQCANPYCAITFIPKRSDQEFHSPKCQNDFSNSLSPEERKNHAFNKAVKKNELTLAKIYGDSWAMGGNGRNVSRRVFEQRKFKFEFYNSVQENKNEEPIYWMEILGIQSNGKETSSYTIHLRPRNKSVVKSEQH